MQKQNENASSFKYAELNDARYQMNRILMICVWMHKKI